MTGCRIKRVGILFRGKQQVYLQTFDPRENLQKTLQNICLLLDVLYQKRKTLIWLLQIVAFFKKNLRHNLREKRSRKIWFLPRYFNDEIIINKNTFLYGWFVCLKPGSKIKYLKAIALRYLIFEPGFKLGWCRARDLFGSRIPVTTGEFELQISSCIRPRAKKNTLVSGNVGGEKNLHPGGRKIFFINLTVCCYYVTYEFQSESTLYSLPECQGTPFLNQAPYLKFK